MFNIFFYKTGPKKGMLRDSVYISIFVVVIISFLLIKNAIHRHTVIKETIEALDGTYYHCKCVVPHDDGYDYYRAAYDYYIYFSSDCTYLYSTDEDDFPECNHPLKCKIYYKNSGYYIDSLMYTFYDLQLLWENGWKNPPTKLCDARGPVFELYYSPQE